MKKLICLLMLGVAMSASAQSSCCKKHEGKQCEEHAGMQCGNPYKRYTCHLPFVSALCLVIKKLLRM